METFRSDRCCFANAITRERRCPLLSLRPRGRVHEREAWRERALPSFVLDYGSTLLASHPGWPVGLGANTLVFVSGIRFLLSGLTWPGVLHSWFLGSSIYAAFGPGGYALVCLYFIVGSLARDKTVKCEKSDEMYVCRPRKLSLKRRKRQESLKSDLEDVRLSPACFGRNLLLMSGI